MTYFSSGCSGPDVIEDQRLRLGRRMNAVGEEIGRVGGYRRQQEIQDGVLLCLAVSVKLLANSPA